MPNTSHLAAAANAADNLLALCNARNGWSYRDEDYVIADAGNRGCRVVVTRPPADATAAINQLTALAAEHLPGRPIVVEDTFGTMPLEHYGFKPFARVPVMIRDASASVTPGVAGEAPAGKSAALRVIIAKSASEVDDVERLMVDAMPLAALQPWHHGVLFPADPANIPGWVMWLGLHAEVPIGCCATYDDEHTIGLYGMAVNSQHRRKGVGRTLLEVILRHYAGRSSCLTSTDDGFWLYASAGYRTVGQAAWWGLERAQRSG